jgi:rare lipoprotein A
MIRLAMLAVVLALAACSGAPKKSDPPPSTSTTSPPARPGTSPRKVSPYAPAQEDPSKRGDYVAGGLYAPGVKDSTPTYIPDVDAIPEPEVDDEPRSRYGNRSPYKVLGRAYHVLERPDGYVEEGLASYYGNKFHGRLTSSQEVYDMYAFTAAHKSLPLPSFARVTNLENGRSVVVRVNDRGPFHEGRVIDLSYAAAVKLGVHPRGTGRVEVRGLTPADGARPDYAAQAAVRAGIDPGTGLPPGVRVATGKPQRMPPSAIDALVDSLPAGSADARQTAPEATPVAVQTVAVAGANDWRFDMRPDGRAMMADEFDAWMKSRRARVATGKPGKPDPYGSAAAAAAVAVAAGTGATVPAVAVAAPPSPPAAEMRAAPPAMPAAANSAQGVVLQVAAFGARANAERALGMLQGVGIGDARLLDGMSAGKPVWRLRVGPMDAAGVAELSARVAGLGFGTPQVVRE